MVEETQNLHTMIQDQESELAEGEYLGTFRWKKGINFPALKFPYDNLLLSYTTISKWSDFIENRVEAQLEPPVIDAFSYPLTVISAFNELCKVFPNFSLIYEKTINIVFIGASTKCEERIAMETNYFDEIYFYLLSIRSIKITSLKENLFNLNLYFVGEEISKNISYSSKTNNIKYFFFKQTFGVFLKDYALELNKTNSIIVGLNTGLGAGYLKLSLNWVPDLVKILKLNYICVFSYTNDYEDKAGEIAIFEKVLKANFLFKKDDNDFKSMTTYQGENEGWSCGNFGFYGIQGSKSGVTLNNVQKSKPEDINKIVKEALLSVNINIKS